jgi:hypothetical protein
MDLSESLFSTKPESFRRNLSENTFRPNWNLSGRIFQKIFSAKLESFRMESFRRNPSELFLQKWNLTEWNDLEGIFQKIFFQNRNLSEWNLSEGTFQKESFRRIHSKRIFQKQTKF